MINLKFFNEVSSIMIATQVDEIIERQEEAGNTKDPYIRWKKQMREIREKEMERSQKIRERKGEI